MADPITEALQRAVANRLDGGETRKAMAAVVDEISTGNMVLVEDRLKEAEASWAEQVAAFANATPPVPPTHADYIAARKRAISRIEIWEKKLARISKL